MAPRGGEEDDLADISGGPDVESRPVRERNFSDGATEKPAQSRDAGRPLNEGRTRAFVFFSIAKSLASKPSLKSGSSSGDPSGN